MRKTKTLRERRGTEREQRGVKDKVWKATEQGGSQRCGGVSQLPSLDPYQILAVIQKHTQFGCMFGVCINHNVGTKIFSR